MKNGETQQSLQRGKAERFGSCKRPSSVQRQLRGNARTCYPVRSRRSPSLFVPFDATDNRETKSQDLPSPNIATPAIRQRTCISGDESQPTGDSFSSRPTSGNVVYVMRLQCNSHCFGRLPRPDRTGTRGQGRETGETRHRIRNRKYQTRWGSERESTAPAGKIMSQEHSAKPLIDGSQSRTRRHATVPTQPAQHNT